MGELTLLLFGLTSPRHRGAASEFVKWAESMAHVLWPEVESMGDRLLGKMPLDPIDTKPRASAMLLLFPILEAITSRRSHFHETVSELLAVAAHTKHRQNNRDLAFACDVAGVQDCCEDSMTDLATHIALWDRNPSFATSSWHYDVTHAIFYATKFGRRRVSWNSGLHVWLNTHLGSLVTHRLAVKDYDLAAELLASIAWADLDTTIPFWTGMDALANVVEAEGCVPAYPPLRGPWDDTFQNSYHATLVSLSALAEGALQANPCR